MKEKGNLQSHIYNNLDLSFATDVSIRRKSKRKHSFFIQNKIHFILRDLGNLQSAKIFPKMFIE